MENRHCVEANHSRPFVQNKESGVYLCKKCEAALREAQAKMRKMIQDQIVSQEYGDGGYR